MCFVIETTCIRDVFAMRDVWRMRAFAICVTDAGAPAKAIAIADAASSRVGWRR